MVQGKLALTVKGRGSFAVCAVSLAALIAGCGDFLSGAWEGYIRVTTQTIGDDLDPDGYTVHLYSGGPGLPIGINDTKVIPTVPGRYDVELREIAGNCEVGGSGSTREISVVIHQTTELKYSVTCTALRLARGWSPSRGTEEAAGEGRAAAGYNVTGQVGSYTSSGLSAVLLSIAGPLP